MKSRSVELLLQDGTRIQGVIKNLESRKSVEYLKLDNDQEYRLDHVHSLLDIEERKEHLINAQNAEEAVKVIKSGDNVFIHKAVSAPQSLIQAMSARGGELKDVSISHCIQRALRHRQKRT